MSPKKSPEEVALAMKSLRSGFDKVLVERVAFFSDALSQFSQQNFVLLANVIGFAHQLSGSCGSFELHHLGRLARQIEVNGLLFKEQPNSEIAQNNVCDAIEQFILVSSQEVGQPSMMPRMTSTQIVFTPKSTKDVWLVLSDSEFRSALEAQLAAFDFTVRSFSSYAECKVAIQERIPALLFCATKLAGESLFSQDSLLDCVVQNKTKLMLCSKEENFEVRANAVRHKAQAFFVDLPDMTRVLQQITRLFDEMDFQDKKVSILDDDLLLAEHYSWVLESAGIEVQIIESPDEAVSDLLSFKPDLLLLDMHMPDYSGSEVSGVIRQFDQLSSLHITFLSAEQDIQQQLHALSFGADDFITKPISNQNLVSAVKLRLARNRDIKSLIERDSLTGLVRHGAIKDAVHTEFEKMKRCGEHFCVAMVDLDHFKRVNDTYGHAIGDVVISTIATLLQKRLRRSDRAGRYGGEEFLVVLPNCSAANAKRLLDSLLSAFTNIQFSDSDQVFSCTFSAGLVCSSSDTEGPDALIEAADQALYQAKHNGRNQVAIFEDV